MENKDLGLSCPQYQAHGNTGLSEELSGQQGILGRCDLCNGPSHLSVPLLAHSTQAHPDGSDSS
jgi:hypothetical protein